MTLKVPPNLSSEEGFTVAVAVVTTVVGAAVLVVVAVCVVTAVWVAVAVLVTSPPQPARMDASIRSTNTEMNNLFKFLPPFLFYILKKVFTYFV
jgi:hypothetical protein